MSGGFANTLSFKHFYKELVKNDPDDSAAQTAEASMETLAKTIDDLISDRPAGHPVTDFLKH